MHHRARWAKGDAGGKAKAKGDRRRNSLDDFIVDLDEEEEEIDSQSEEEDVTEEGSDSEVREEGEVLRLLGRHAAGIGRMIGACLMLSNDPTVGTSVPCRCR